jgi:hypothetical protein
MHNKGFMVNERSKSIDLEGVVYFCRIVLVFATQAFSLLCIFVKILDKYA